MTDVPLLSDRGEAIGERDAQAGDVVTVAAGGAINTSAGVINAGLGFLITVLVARQLGAGGAGELFAAVAVFSVLELTSELGSVTAIVRPVSRYLALGQTKALRTTIVVALGPCAVLACVMAAALLVFAGELSSVLVRHGDREAVAEYLRILALVLPFSVVGDIMLGATRGFGSMAPSAAIDLIVKPGLRVALLLVILHLSHAPELVGFGWAFPIVVACVLGGAALRILLRNSRHRGDSTAGTSEGSGRRALAIEFWRFALPQSLSSILQVAVVWIDVILLGALKSSRDAGTYAALSRYLLVGTLGLSAIALAIAPLMSRLLGEQELVRAGAVYRIVTVWIVATSFPIYFVMAVFSPVLMQVFGRSFSGGSVALTVLSVAMLANIATGPVVMILLMGGRSSWILIDSSVSLLVNVVLNLVLIPPYGMTGAAVAWGAGISR